jgi:hypothetical protein
MVAAPTKTSIHHFFNKKTGVIFLVGQSITTCIYKTAYRVQSKLVRSILISRTAFDFLIVAHSPPLQIGF